jgi:23S rRNA pseudouridine1911/1915/1917 synthase
MNLQIVYEDNHLIAVNKPGGVVVQFDESGDFPLDEEVKQYVKKRYNKPGAVWLGVIHRIDKPVSGVVVFARTEKALVRMNKIFHDRLVKKEYWAVTNERPEPLSGTLIHYLDKNREQNKSIALDAPSRRHPDAKLSELSYELLGELGENHLLKVLPVTGRPHQIRVQLSKMGWSIRADAKYGNTFKSKGDGIYLHCKSLTFIHPVKNEPITIKAPIPERDQIWDLFRDISDD